MFKRPYYIALALVALLTLLVLNLPGSTAARLKLAIGSIFLPLFGVTGAAQQATAKAGDALLPKSEFIRANEALRRQNQELRFQLMQAGETTRENIRLRQLVGWNEKSPWKLKLAHVIARDPANWWRTVQIDAGARDGIQTNQPVLTVEGFLVGRIATVSYLNSQVVLIGDRDCRVSALIENSTHDVGVLSASGPLDTSLVQMNYLSSSANLKSGQNVFTSGLGGVFPKGIPIGKIYDAQSVEYGLATEARVKLNANLGALEQVSVLIK